MTSRVSVDVRWDGVGPDPEPLEPDIRLPPGFSANVHSWREGAEKTHYSLDSDNSVPNSYYEPGSDSYPERQEEWGDGIELEMPPPKDDLDLAAALITMRATSEFHEAFEWITLNGKHLADPHPDADSSKPNGVRWECWDWLSTEMRSLVDRYIERYPHGNRA